ncbi:FeS cluster insertion protein [Penicillium lagena]|uniref:FeS cluster insertion protein n=1 Tax=Penicillium lagena TaxID=94218 RepID=UPI0025414E0E|nr:FeS cluster insertion protein [Penicillium lagena]KAJ5604745.1 FeS cluster insertion protein [Penicillium lagena]
MSRPLLSSTAARRFSQAPQTRLFSTSRPAQRLSAFPDGKLTACRQFIHIQQSAPRCLSRHSTPRSSFLRPQHASFSSSTVRPATKVTQNPRAGDDGATLMVKISPRAVERLREITDPTTSPSATREDNPYHHLRITVTSGGCHGFQYMMSLESANKIDAEEDTIFEGEEDVATTDAAGGEAKVVMDEPSLELLHGSTVDYTTELIGSQFKIVDNPRATSNCGCGTSFDVSD